MGEFIDNHLGVWVGLVDEAVTLVGQVVRLFLA